MDVAKRVHMVFQDPKGSLNPRMPIWKIVAEGGGTREEALDPEVVRTDELPDLLHAEAAAGAQIDRGSDLSHDQGCRRAEQRETAAILRREVRDGLKKQAPVKHPTPGTGRGDLHLEEKQLGASLGHVSPSGDGYRICVT